MKEKCKTCNGSGRVKNPDSDGTLPSCEPLYIDCEKCKGTGYVQEPRKEEK